jgi:hypothetical protein
MVIKEFKRPRRKPARSYFWIPGDVSEEVEEGECKAVRQ